MRCSTRSRASFAPTSLCGRAAEMIAPGASPPEEDSLPGRSFRPLATDPGAFDLGADAAILKALGEDIVVTTDAIVEALHFLPNDPPGTIAQKALRLNLFDLGGKGA